MRVPVRAGIREARDTAETHQRPIGAAPSLAKTSIMPTWAADVAALWGVQAHAQSVPFGHLAPVPGSAPLAPVDAVVRAARAAKLKHVPKASFRGVLLS